MEFSRITEDLFIGDTPASKDYNRLREIGVRLVINMRFEQGPAPDPGSPQLDFLWLRTFDTPCLPIPLRVLQRGVRGALKTIQTGGRVYAHCAKGRHRGVAMGAAILIAQGYSPQEAMRLIKDRRPAADPWIFYIRRRILRFAHQFKEFE